MKMSYHVIASGGNKLFSADLLRVNRSLTWLIIVTTLRLLTWET